jgi:hypothetical protein
VAAAPRFADALRVLVEHEVDFLVVGGVAAVLQGAPVSTLDLDVLYSPAAGNLARLEAALASMDAKYRDPAGRLIRPDAARLASGGHHLLSTSMGPVDALGSVGAGQTYEQLLGRSVEIAAGDLRVRVLDLAALIETKEQAGREKDRATLPILRETLRLRSS